MFFGLPFGPRAQIGKKLLPRTIALIFLFLSMTLISCGGGGLVGNNSVTAKPGTSSGTYAITVTGSAGSLSHTTQVTLIVQ
jgi:hypothetical protein